MAAEGFAARLHAAVDRCGAPLCVGFDPLPDQIPALFGDARRSVQAVEDFCAEMLERVVGNCAAIKPQLGFFEPYGADGLAVVQRLTAQARACGVPVILDAKRGDIGSTAEGYARAMLGPAPGLDGDCVTVNPYLGADSLEPFLTLAQATGKGVAVLVRTSNPGARDLQDLDVGGSPLWVRVAEMLKPAMARLADGDWSNLMVVAGATWPDEARRLREVLPSALFLVPGYGAQGASAADALAGLVRPLGSNLPPRGGVVSASRSILYPAAAREARSLPEWRAAIDTGLAHARADLSGS